MDKDSHTPAVRTVGVLSEDGLVGLGRVADAVDVLGSHAELVLLALLETLDGVRGVADDVGQCRPEVVVVLLALDDVASQLGAAVVLRRRPRQRAVVRVHVLSSACIKK